MATDDRTELEDLLRSLAFKCTHFDTYQRWESSEFELRVRIYRTGVSIRTGLGPTSLRHADYSECACENSARFVVSYILRSDYVDEE